MKQREVTEYDLRAPEFMFPDIKPEDYEFRGDGKIVRKDRWETAVRRIADAFGVSREFEIDDVVERVQRLAHDDRQRLPEGWGLTVRCRDGRFLAVLACPEGEIALAPSEPAIGLVLQRLQTAFEAEESDGP